MEWLNYHHLLYFWVVAREGGLVPAGKILHLSHPTLSAQIRALEERLGAELFSRERRKLALTETGRVAYRYAEAIFGLGREMLDALAGRAVGGLARLDVGIVDVMPKLVVHRLLAPSLALPEPVRLVCHEDSHDELLAQLGRHTLDIVLADAPVPPGSSVRAYNHLLGECGVSFFGTRALAARYRRRFPQSLDGAPMLLPLEGVGLRRALDHWFEVTGVRPRVVAEFEDSALLKVFGAEGLGIFTAPTPVEREVKAQYRVELLGRAPDVKERFYAISAERRLKNPAVLAITQAARHEFFGS